jgi:hypothetical protein
MHADGDCGEPAAESVMWVLVSPNNRRLGRGGSPARSFERCRESVLSLRRRHGELRAVTTASEHDGQWSWRIDLDGAAVAAATRAFLRQQECDYNLRRFLAAVPQAQVASVVHAVRIGRLPAAGRP